MVVGVAFLPPSFPPSRTQAFYIIKRQNCLNICNRVQLLYMPSTQVIHAYTRKQRRYKYYDDRISKDLATKHNTRYGHSTFPQGGDIFLQIVSIWFDKKYLLQHEPSVKSGLISECILTLVLLPIKITKSLPFAENFNMYVSCLLLWDVK